MHVGIRITRKQKDSLNIPMTPFIEALCLYKRNISLT